MELNEEQLRELKNAVITGDIVKIVACVEEIATAHGVEKYDEGFADGETSAAEE